MTASLFLARNHTTLVSFIFEQIAQVLNMLLIGQGIKVCPKNKISEVCQPHTRATREALKFRLQQSQQPHHPKSAQCALFEKTLSLFRSHRTAGCLGPAGCDSILPGSPDSDGDSGDSDDTLWKAQTDKNRRGHAPKRTCKGKIMLDYDNTGRAFIWSVPLATNPALKCCADFFGM